MVEATPLRPGAGSGTDHPLRIPRGGHWPALFCGQNLLLTGSAHLFNESDSSEIMIGRPNENTIRQRVWALVEPVCVDAGFELVDVRFVTEQSGWVLRVFIDLPAAPSTSPAATAPPADADAASPVDAESPADGDAASPVDGDVDLSDCERVSREISAVLDVDDSITLAYSLEVSSPGIDRPLVTEAHFRRYVGAEIKATLLRGVPTEQGSERKNFRGMLTGVEGEGQAAAARVVVDGQPWLLPIHDVDTARIVPDWDAVMKGGRGQIRTPAPAPGAGKGHGAKRGPHQAHPGRPGPRPGRPRHGND